MRSVLEDDYSEFIAKFVSSKTVVIGAVITK